MQKKAFPASHNLGLLGVMGGSGVRCGCGWVAGVGGGVGGMGPKIGVVADARF